MPSLSWAAKKLSKGEYDAFPVWDAKQKQWLWLVTDELFMKLLPNDMKKKAEETKHAN